LLALDCLRYYPGLKTAVVFSSSSVWTKAASPLKAESGHMADIAAAEKALLRLCSERGVDLLLLRPTLIWGCGLDRNISLLARFGRRFGFIPVSGDAQGLRQPVHADDLARLAVRALGSEPPLAMQSAVCGGSTLTYRAMVRLIAEACPGPVRLLTLPRGLLSSLVSLPALLPAYRGINAEMVNRQSQDMTFDDSLLRDALNAQARSFEPSPADFEIPAYARALQLPV
jgi:nucleoside-diphosphate-sugar epimerase